MKKRTILLAASALYSGSTLAGTLCTSADVDIMRSFMQESKTLVDKGAMPKAAYITKERYYILSQFCAKRIGVNKFCQLMEGNAHEYRKIIDSTPERAMKYLLLENIVTIGLWHRAVCG